MRCTASTVRAAVLALLAVPALLVAPAGAAPAAAPQDSWHADQARVPDARAAGRDGRDVVVAVLDSWVDAAHPDFEGRVLAGADCLGGSCRPGPAVRDQCDHGTHVAGTVASSSYGVAPGATVLPVRVLSHDPANGDCVGRPDDVAAGIRWAVSSGARVVNLSLGPDVPGLSTSSSIPPAVEEAARAGVVVVFSAGNASLPVSDAYGGSALIVAATGPDGELASYSQRGVGVDLAAPGGDAVKPDVCTQDDCVTSLFPDNRYSVAAGTSMAAPHVAGVAALLLGQDPARTREQVFERLLSTASPLAEAGRGLLDARAALGAPAREPAMRARSSAPPRTVVVVPPRRPAAAAPAARSPARPAPAPRVPRVAAAPSRPASTPHAVPATTAPVTAAPVVAARPPAPPAPVGRGMPAPAVAVAAALALAAGGGSLLAARLRR